MTLEESGLDQASGMHDLHGSNAPDLPVRRGPGRPVGSRNRPKMSPLQRQALKDELGADYRAAIVARTLAETRARGLTALIQERLGRDGLAEIRAGVIAEHEAQTDASLKADDAARSSGIAA